MKKILFVSLIALSATTLQAREIWTGDILGRDLSVPGGQYIGHVGVAIERYPEMPAGSVTEALNEPKVIQTNKISNFKSRDVFWGNSWGLIDEPGRMNMIRLEANIQKFTCPVYTLTTYYEPGVYDGTTGQILKCGTFRCDTYVNYLYHKAGYDLPTYESVTLPILVFNSLPYRSFDTLTASVNELETYELQDLLNVMYDTNESNYNRQYAIELIGGRGDKTKIHDLMNFYSSDLHEDVKSSVLMSMQSLYQNHGAVAGLQDFYFSLMHENISEKDMQFVARGYTSISSTEDILDNLALINSSLEKTYEHAKNSIKTNLAMSNPELERVFFKDIAGTEEGQFSIGLRRLPLLAESVQHLRSIS
jgi:hypothetical protein